MKLYAQGDVILERVDDVPIPASARPVATDPDGAVVLARGEVTGHRHAFYAAGGEVTMFRDDGLGSGMPAELYVGHVKIEVPTAKLQHEEHGTIELPKGLYRIRRQREFNAGEMRIVAD